MSRRTRWTACLLVLAMLVVSCGGESSAVGDEQNQSADGTEATGVVTRNIEAGERQAAEPTATRVPANAVPTLIPRSEADVREPAAEAERFDRAGPYAAGVSTITVADRTVEIWYPAEPEAVTGGESEMFDSLTVFPEAMQALIPAELSGVVDTGAFRDVPAARGLFPAVIYGHGFGGYRQVATDYTTHLASWGYVVMSMDHLERGIAEQASDTIGAGEFDETNTRPNAAVEDVQALLDHLAVLNAEGLLVDRVDLSRVAITGHSAGGWAAVNAAAAEPDRIDTWISIAGGAGDEPPTQTGVVVIAELDAIVEPERSEELFDQVLNATRLVNIANAGHNSFTDACRGILDLGGLSSLVALIGERQVTSAEDGCVERFVTPELAQDLLNHVTVAHLRTEFEQPVAAGSLALEHLETITPLADYRLGP